MKYSDIRPMDPFGGLNLQSEALVDCVRFDFELDFMQKANLSSTETSACGLAKRKMFHKTDENEVENSVNSSKNVSRIFSTLSVVSVLLLTVVIWLGLSIGDYNRPWKEVIGLQEKLRELQLKPQSAETDTQRKELQDEFDTLYEDLQPLRSRASNHKMFAIFTGIFTVLVNCIGVTYFIGTSRWCKEVVQTYSMSTSFVDESDKIKRRSFPWAVLGFFTVLGIIAMGAAADPATLRQTTSRWVTPHLWAGIGGTTFIAWAFFSQFVQIQSHGELVERILAEVRRIRIEKGLDVEG